jgi:hypothetical protein
LNKESTIHFGFPNVETGEFGGFYLWETEEAMEEEIRTRTG